MPDNKTILEKLQKIQSELKVPKSQTNAFGKYKYRSCEEILEAVKKLAAANDACVILSDELVETGGRVHVKSTAKLVDAGGEISATGFAREAETKKGMDDSQITGAASSYSRKYALNGLFAIDDAKDSDHTGDGTPAPLAQNIKDQISGAQTLEDLTKIYNENKGKGDEFTNLVKQKKAELS